MKCQDGNGSSHDDGYADDSDRKPQEHIQHTVPQTADDDHGPATDEAPDPSDPHSKSRGRDELLDFFNTADLPVDLNAADVKRLMNEYLARLNKGLRT